MPTTWIDFAAVKASVSMETLLAHYGVQLRRVNQSALRGKCPLPTHTSKSDTTFAVNTKKNVWACQSQSCVAARNQKRGGNVLDFIAIMEKCSIRDAAAKITDWFNMPSNGRASPVQDHSSDQQKPVAKKTMERGANNAIREDAQNKPLGFALRNIAHSHPYLTTRGITAETAQYFGIGFFSGRGSMRGRVVIPIHNREGEIVAYAGRSIDDSEPKYKLPNGFRKSCELFSLHRARACGNSLIIVVEGFFGTIRIHQAGYPNVVALMGSSLSEEQEDMLAEFAHIILMLDGDSAGRKATPEIAERLTRRTFVKTIDLPDGIQPDKLSPEEIRSVLGSR